jgi:hypothetical protein
VASFYPGSQVAGNSSQLLLSVAGNAPIGTFSDLLVRGVAAGLSDQTARLTLTITGAPIVLILSSPALTIVRGAASLIAASRSKCR